MSFRRFPWHPVALLYWALMNRTMVGVTILMYLLGVLTAYTLLGRL